LEQPEAVASIRAAAATVSVLTIAVFICGFPQVNNQTSQTWPAA
jgi:hypothetical protein